MRGILVFAALGACAVLVDCTKPMSSPGEPVDASDDAVADVVDASSAPVPVDAGKGRVMTLGATAQTSVLDAPWWPESGKGSRRLGYLRHGAVVEAYERTTLNGDCKEGWFELERSGFVCGKAVSVDVTSPKVRLAPKQPDHDAGMPYRYGLNVQDGTPLYRRVLSTDDRKKYEPWLAPPKPAPDDTPSAPEAAKTETAEKAEKPESAEAEEDSQTSKPSASLDAGIDAGRPKLRSLKGRGVLVRTMARGFYLGLDRTFTSNGSRWWRTTLGFAAPFDRIMLQRGATKHTGTWFSSAVVEAPDAGPDAGDDGGDGGDGGPNPATIVAFVKVGFARKFDVTGDMKKVAATAELPKRTAVMLDGKAAEIAGVDYRHTTSEFWVRMMDLTVAQPAVPSDLHAGEKWIDVDLTRQALVAFEGTTPVFATLISSGKRNPQDKEHDFPTPTGSFRIREKHVTTTMDGDVASDGPYSIEDVPWVMYFQGSYALHGAFWHDSFGNKRSHGCVNMAPDDARRLFAWADPVLPAGWHGVFSRDDTSGTRIVVHEDAASSHRGSRP